MIASLAPVTVGAEELEAGYRASDNRLIKAVLMHRPPRLATIVTTLALPVGRSVIGDVVDLQKRCFSFSAADAGVPQRLKCRRL
jgi:hypothetical protein